LSSEWWGWHVSPAAVVVGRIQLQESDMIKTRDGRTAFDPLDDWLVERANELENELDRCKQLLRELEVCPRCGVRSERRVCELCEGDMQREFEFGNRLQEDALALVRIV